MDKIRMWGIVISVGSILAVIGLGLAASGAGVDTEQDVSQEWTVDPDYVYYLEMDAKADEPIELDYALSSGTMRVQMLSTEGLDNLIETGAPGASETYWSRSSQTSGAVDWTPDETDTYVLAFYDFSVDGAQLEVAGTFTSASSTMLFVGIGLVVVGVVIAALGAVKRRQRAYDRDLGKPQDVVMYPETTQPEAEKQSKLQP